MLAEDQVKIKLHLEGLQSSIPLNLNILERTEDCLSQK